MTDRPPTRSELLTDLAAAVNELTRPRQTSEYVETAVTRTVTTRSGKTRAKRTRERRRHVVTLPALLVELDQAAVPGSSAPGAPAGGFESRPSAELEPLSVLREISDDVGYWARRFRLEEKTLAAMLQALVSARHDDEQLAQLVRQSARWVHRARVATGHEPAPITLRDPCPYCGRGSALVIAGDLRSAKCGRCGTRWSVDTIGLLADMLRANQEREVMPEVRCWWPNCGEVGPHEVHGDGAGRLFRDRCDVTDRPGESMTA